MNPEEKHESYGIINFSRGTCQPPINLFGSSIRHNNIITLTISEGIKSRDYQQDRYHAGKRFIEVDMSSTQFADAITHMNMGAGVPVTVKYVEGDKWNEEKSRFREDCPEVNYRKQATDELKEEMLRLSRQLNTLKADAEEILKRTGTIKKAEKEKLLKDLMFIEQEIRSNIPFAHQCFNESVNKVVTEAKVEIDATYQTMREKLGDKVLAGEIQIPMLEENNKQEEDNEG